jgi:hypothetical protein
MNHPIDTAFVYEMTSFPFFFWKHDSFEDTGVLTRRFYKNLRTYKNITDLYVLDNATGLTYGEMALFIIYTKNQKRIQHYKKTKRKTCTDETVQKSRSS